MKLTFFLPVLLFGLSTTVLAVDWDRFSITTNEDAKVRQILKDYENGKTPSLTPTNTEEFREFVGYYFLHSNDISLKDKLPISLGFAACGMCDRAVTLGTAYVGVYSNDWNGWELLGGCYISMGLTNDAINAYGKAVELGDEKSYEAFAGLALINDQPDIVKPILPKLIALKDNAKISKEAKLHLISILLFYSMKADEKNIFVETLERENLKEILQNDSVKQNIMSGCEVFQGPDIDKIRKELELATRGSLGSTTTNTLPP